MDRRLKRLIDEYLSSVRMAVALLEEAGVPRPTSNHDWALNGISGTGALKGGARLRPFGSTERRYETIEPAAEVGREPTLAKSAIGPEHLHPDHFHDANETRVAAS